MVDFPRFLLADFEDPPVVETVLSLQFERLTAIQTVHLGLFWHRVKRRFPKTEERPALPQAIERFPGLDTVLRESFSRLLRYQYLPASCF